VSGKNPLERAGDAVDRALDRDRDGTMDVREGSASTTGRTSGTERDEIAVPVAEERLNVEKRSAELGQVEIRKTVQQEQVSVPVELMREEVQVQQRDIADRPAQAGDNLFQEGTIRVPVRGEEAVVTKQAVVTGEVVIDKEQLVERQNVTDTVRRERVEVDKDYDQHRSNFQQHFTQRQGTAQGATRSFEEAEPNYQYGYAAARGDQYSGRNFDDVEPDLRRDYETRYGGSRSGTSGTSGSTGTSGTSGSTGTSGTSGSTGTSGSGGSAWEHLREEIREGYNRARGGR